MSQQDIEYSEKYYDDDFEYRCVAAPARRARAATRRARQRATRSRASLWCARRSHVILPKHVAKNAPKRLLSESEWRGLGVQQSRGWVHYAIHR